MNVASIVTALGYLKDLGKQFGGNDKARALIELLEKQIQLMEREAQTRGKQIGTLEFQLAEVTKERDKLSEELAAMHLDTEEVIEHGLLYRKTSKGKDGPFCPNHKDVRLSRPGGSMWYCHKCRVPLGD
jgi:hypothetical protein